MRIGVAEETACNDVEKADGGSMELGGQKLTVDWVSAHVRLYSLDLLFATHNSSDPSTIRGRWKLSHPINSNRIRSQPAESSFFQLTSTPLWARSEWRRWTIAAFLQRPFKAFVLIDAVIRLDTVFKLSECPSSRHHDSIRCDSSTWLMSVRRDTSFQATQWSLMTAGVESVLIS